MKNIITSIHLFVVIIVFYLPLVTVRSQSNLKHLVVNGVSWYDTNGNVINAHGACVVYEGGKYWLFGEYKSNNINQFNGFSCYSSNDLVSWKFERIVLSVQSDGILGPGRIGERVKVMRCPATGKFVMFMHADDLKYKDPYIGIAMSDSINGEYKMLGPILYQGKPIKRWDMGTFKDNDGTGYLLIHHGPIYKLSADYLTVDSKVAHVEGMGESPAMIRRNGRYFLLSSGLTSWERNDNFYFTSENIAGPWIKKGLFCPEGTLTHNSQTTFILNVPVKDDTISVFMGDRWSFPKQKASATYVWMPLDISGDTLRIPEFWDSWNVNTITPERPAVQKIIKADWMAQIKGEALIYQFVGERIGFTGLSDGNGGYAKVAIINESDEVVFDTYVDFYSKVPNRGYRFISPKLPHGSYKLLIEVSGENSVWYDKKKNCFGSNGYNVNVENVVVFE
ncbi:MAG: family 43 glycosylhydrolase [Paraprevotella sp.]|jgi:hypothetical protein|nr:family 43 glycosylhydrolase [Paraprevotella sp.]